MVYEKKILILSGEGKGVVLTEKSALGVKFALRTFGLSRVPGRKAGVVTKDFVAVRDLPDTADPCTVFFLDDADLSSLHFAVFSTELELYGTFAKPMWESNLMDLLRAKAAPTMPHIPPAIERRQDDPIPTANYYSGLDMTKRMLEVDAFLDGERVIVAPNPQNAAAAESARAADAETVDADSVEECETEKRACEPVQTAADTERIETFDSADGRDLAESTDAAVEAAATLVSEKPWEKQARYLKKSSVRAIAQKTDRIEKISVDTVIAPVREITFFERIHADVNKLFAEAERDEELYKLLPDIEWVKVEFDSHTVSVGRTKAFLCYAVPGVYKKESPFGAESQWLPKRRNAPTGKGYWLVFQDHVTGELIKTC